jgi:hypothetical protein
MFGSSNELQYTLPSFPQPFPRLRRLPPTLLARASDEGTSVHLRGVGGDAGGTATSRSDNGEAKDGVRHSRCSFSSTPSLLRPQVVVPNIPRRVFRPQRDLHRRQSCSAVAQRVHASQSPLSPSLFSLSLRRNASSPSPFLEPSVNPPAAVGDLSKIKPKMGEKPSAKNLAAARAAASEASAARGRSLRSVGKIRGGMGARKFEQ